MTPEERLLAALKAQNKIVFGNTIGVDSNGECTVVGEDATVRAIAGTPISAGSCVALQADDGQWYAVSAREAGTIQKKTLYKRKNKPPSGAGTSNIIVLFKKDNTLYVGGDRDIPAEIYTLESGFDWFINPLITKTGTGENDWIVNFVLVSQSISTSYKFCSIVGGVLQEVAKTVPSSVPPYIFSGFGKSVFQRGFFTSIGTSIANISDTGTLYYPSGGSHVGIYMVADMVIEGFRTESEETYSYESLGSGLAFTFRNFRVVTETGLVYFSDVYGYELTVNVTANIVGYPDGPYGGGGGINVVSQEITGTSPFIADPESVFSIGGFAAGNFPRRIENINMSFRSFYVNTSTTTPVVFETENLSTLSNAIDPSTSGSLNFNPSPSFTVDAIPRLGVDAIGGFDYKPLVLGREFQSSVITRKTPSDTTEQIIFYDSNSPNPIGDRTLFATPTDTSALFPSGDTRNGKDIFSDFYSPNLVGNTVYCVSVSSEETGSISSVDIIETAIASPPSFKATAQSVTGITEDAGTILDMSFFE